MANNEINVKLKIQDDGSLKLTEKSAKKLGVALEKTGTSAKNTERQLKGAARTSSNSTKNFSKMSQGISGGLVPAYATLAAQIFAVSAAFQFLTEAANYKNMIDGQKAYGAVTGTSYTMITKQLQDATKGQLKYNEAARAAAIGSAAGLNAQQLSELGEVATNVSLALGRDLTDSFNRLIRGVTKAEPELLDELGIILRLDPALEKYAQRLDKSRDKLTAFERQQAVFNEVVEQGVDKFGEMADVMDPKALSLQQFARAFDDLINDLKYGIAEIANVVLPFFTQNVNALAAALTAVAIPIIRSIIPSFKDMQKRVTSTFKTQSAALTQSKQDFASATAAAELYAASQTKLLIQNQKTSAALLANVGVHASGKQGGAAGADFLLGTSNSKAAQTNAKRVLDGAKKQIVEHGEVVTGKLKGMNDIQVADLDASYKQRLVLLNNYQNSRVSIWTRGNNKIKQGWAGLQVAYSGMMKNMAAAGSWILKWGSRMLSVFSWGSILYLGYEAITTMFNFGDETKNAATAQEIFQEELITSAQRARELAAELLRMREARGDFDNLGKKAANLGNAAANANLLQLANDISVFNKQDDEFKESDQGRRALEGYRKLASELSKMGHDMSVFFNALKKGNDVADEDLNTALKRQSALQEVAAATRNLTVSQRDYNTEMRDFAHTAPKLPFADLIKAQGAYLADITEVTKGVREQYAERSSELEKQLKRDEGNMKRIGLDVDKPATRAAIEKNRAILAQPGGTVRPGYGNPGEMQIRLFDQIQANREELAKFTAEVDKQNRLFEFQTKLGKNLENRRTEMLALETETNTILRAKIQLESAGNSFMEQRMKLALPFYDFEVEMNKFREKEIVIEEKVRSLNGDKTSELAKQVLREKEISDDLKKQLLLKLESLGLTYQEGVERIGQDEYMHTLREGLVELTKNEHDIALKILSLKGGMVDETVAEGGTLVRNMAKREQEIALLEAKRAILLQNAEIAKAEAQRIQNDITSDPKDVLNAQNAERAAQRVLDTNERNTDILRNADTIALSKLATEKTDLQMQLERFTMSSQELEVREKIAQIQREGGFTWTPEQEAAAKKQLENMGEMERKLENQKKLSKALEDGFTDMFTSMLDGSKSAKEAFGDMATYILKMILRMIVQAMVMKYLMPLFGGFFTTPAATPNMGGGSGIPSGPNTWSSTNLGGTAVVRNGGVLSQGRKQYTEGGVSSGPKSGYMVEMHGTEAVVPLPGNGKIPVNLVGRVNVPTPIVQLDTAGLTGAFSSALQQNPMQTHAPLPAPQNGGTNNITVNVDANGGTQQDQQRQGGIDQQQANMLGKVVSSAVQVELHKQKRPGGILSPYGAS